MKSLAEVDVKSSSFWLRHPDPTQAAVHLALQWLAYVYPGSQQHLEPTLRQALPHTDPELNTRWREFLEHRDIDDHVEALQWLSKTLSSEQVPFLVESCWRLVLVDYAMPSHVPLALRLMARILDVPEFRVLDIGQRVQREVQDETAEDDRPPLLPDDPRYLDRVEWRLYGFSDPVRPPRPDPEAGSNSGNWRLMSVFVAGMLVGIAGLSFLVWGPMQLGRQPVPRLSHRVPDVQPPASSVNSPVTLPAESNGIAESNNGISVPQADTPVPEATNDTDTGLDADAASETTESSDPIATAEPSETADSNDVASTSSQASEEASAETEEQSDGSAEAMASEEVLMTITASVLNVRAEPSLDAEVVMKLGAGAQVWVDPSQADGFWQRVRVDGEIGYASGRYMTPAE